MAATRCPSGTETVTRAPRFAPNLGKAVYGVRKDAGDDVDVTNRLLICAEVSFFPGREILVEGGEIRIIERIADKIAAQCRPVERKPDLFGGKAFPIISRCQ